MSQNACSAGGKFQPSQGNAKWSQVTSLANSNLGVWGRPQSEQGRGQKRERREEGQGNEMGGKLWEQQGKDSDIEHFSGCLRATQHPLNPRKHLEHS